MPQPPVQANNNLTHTLALLVGEHSKGLGERFRAALTPTLQGRPGQASLLGVTQPYQARSTRAVPCQARTWGHSQSQTISRPGVPDPELPKVQPAPRHCH